MVQYVNCVSGTLTSESLDSLVHEGSDCFSRCWMHAVQGSYSALAVTGAVAALLLVLLLLVFLADDDEVGILRLSFRGSSRRECCDV